MNLKYLLAAVSFVGVLSLSCPALSDIVLAIGLPKGDPSKGWKAGWASDEAGALDACRGVVKATNTDSMLEGVKRERLSEAEKSCKIVGTLHKECFGIASNGTPGEPASALGWNIASNEEGATTGAIAKCDTMRSKKASPCVLRNLRYDK